MGKLFLAIFFMLTLVSCNKRFPDPDCGFIQNGYQQRISWRSQGLVNLYYDPSFPENIKPSFQSAIHTWEAAIGHKVFNLIGVTQSSQSPSKDGFSVVYWLHSWDPVRLNSEQAKTEIYWIGNEMIEADISFNAAGFNISPNPGLSEVDAESLILHELGHALGLGHSTDPESVMFRMLPYGTIRRTLIQSDIQSIQCGYN